MELLLNIGAVVLGPSIVVAVWLKRRGDITLDDLTAMRRAHVDSLQQLITVSERWNVITLPCISNF